MIEEQLDELYDYERPNRYEVFRQKNAPETVNSLYGEVTREGVESVIKNFESVFSDQKTVFYDAGSGYGSMVLHVAMRCPIKQAKGVEYVPERVDSANSKIEKYQYKSAMSPLFVQADFTSSEYDVSDATIVYFDNTCVFRDDVCQTLWDKLPEGCIFLTRQPWMPASESERREGFVSGTTYAADYMMAVYVKGEDR